MADAGPELRSSGRRFWETLPVGIRDQHEAAAKQTHREMLAVTRVLGPSWFCTSETRGDQVMSVLLLAMAGRIKDYCPHARGGPVLGKRTIVHLSMGWAACESCVPSRRDAVSRRCSHVQAVSLVTVIGEARSTSTARAVIP